MANPIRATCDRCGVKVELTPLNLPPSGGALSAVDDPGLGWQFLEFTCGRCWEARALTWTCVHCGDASYELAVRCRGCGRMKPGLPPYQPNLDLLVKEGREREQEHDALVAEWDREYPGWRAASARHCERL